jgi:23S rRNA pseudouridine1911/1915/1917 synthase
MQTEQVEHFRYEGGGKERLDVFLTSHLTGYTRSRLKGLIQDGCVVVNDLEEKKAGRILYDGDLVVARIPATVPSGLIAEDIYLDIIFENDDLLILNKPAGMVVHPSPGHDRGTLVHAVLGYVPNLEGVGGEERPGIVHRLDKDTSGLIVVAKNERAHHWLQDQFRLRAVQKYYLALVDGRPPTPTGRVEAPIGRNTTHRKLMSVVPAEKGREAISHYSTRESFSAHSLLEVHPLTGRTHQIRVHLAFLGCPVVGDKVYGKKKSTLPLDRHFLHAYKLQITLPGEKEPRTFEAPLPPELTGALDLLRHAQESHETD